MMLVVISCQDALRPGVGAAQQGQSTWPALEECLVVLGAPPWPSQLLLGLLQLALELLQLALELLLPSPPYAWADGPAAH